MSINTSESESESEWESGSELDLEEGLWRNVPFIEGKVDKTVDPHLPLEDGLFPLHYAALSHERKLVSFLYWKKAKPDVRCNCVGHKFHGMIPLQVALESAITRYSETLADWTPKESFIKSLFMFCSPEWINPMETMCSLAGGMEPKLIQDIVWYYAQRDNLIPLAALLASLSMALSPRWISNSELMNHLATNLMSLTVVEQEHKLTGSDHLVDSCKEKQRLMIAKMCLLESYERISSPLETLLSLSFFTCPPLFHTETPLERAHWAFSQPRNLSPKERHLRLFERTKRKFLWDGCHDKNIAMKDPMFSLIVQIENCYLQRKKKTTRRPFQHLQQRSMSMHSWHVKSGLFSVVQSSHLQHFKTRNSFCTSMESQTKESFQVIKRQVLDLLLNKKVQTSSLVIRRVIGRV